MGSRVAVTLQHEMRQIPYLFLLVIIASCRGARCVRSKCAGCLRAPCMSIRAPFPPHSHGSRCLACKRVEDKQCWKRVSAAIGKNLVPCAFFALPFLGMIKVACAT